MVSGISLSNKSQLLFGFAVVVILTAALTVPWIRTQSMVREYQIELARQVADVWRAEQLLTGALDDLPPEGLEQQGERHQVRLLPLEAILMGAEDGFVMDALKAFQADLETREQVTRSRQDGEPVYRYARAVRASQLPAFRLIPDESAPEDDPLVALLVVDLRGEFAAGQLLVSRVFIIAAGIVASLLAVLVFYFILTKLIFSPVRRLRETAEKIQRGDLTIRSQIRTGDEFQQLSEAFDGMLDRVEQSQVQLRAMNESLDLKVGELAEANVGLDESNRLKSEFLASVSHELRTPLNSIIGFAELLEEMGRGDAEVNPKRLRYLSNILTSAHSLLEMINELLDMAKIEAGRMEVNIEPTSVGDLVEGLLGLMRPQAEAKNIEVIMSVGRYVPVIETDPGKLQQILYNFLSNALKFTPPGGTVNITADRVTRQNNTLGVRLGVADSGPGIPDDMQDVIFEKFRQLDAGHTRQHAGTGLGLAICRDLAELLGAQVSFVSEPGRGATFFVDLPLTHQPDEPQPLMA